MLHEKRLLARILRNCHRRRLDQDFSMKERIFDWFLEHQLKIVIIIGIISLVIQFSLSEIVLPIIFSFLFSLIIIFIGSRLYQTETSENWIKFSYVNTIKNVFGLVFISIGWVIFLRRFFAQVIAAIFLKFS